MLEQRTGQISVAITIATNWTTTTVANFSGDGRNDGDDGYREAASNWTVAVSGFGDADSDGVSDNLDICDDTQEGQEMLNESMFPGCTWEQLDSDADGVQNGDDMFPFNQNLDSTPIRGSTMEEWLTAERTLYTPPSSNFHWNGRPFAIDINSDG